MSGNNNNYNALATEIDISQAVFNPSAAVPSLELQTLPLSNVPPATGTIIVPQAPSGSVTGESSTWEYANTELAAKYFTSNLINAAHDGTSNPSPQTAVTPGTAPNGPSVGGTQPTLETTPSAPSGSYAMQGVTAIANTLSISYSFAGVSPAAIQVYNFGSSLGNI